MSGSNVQDVDRLLGELDALLTAGEELPAEDRPAAVEPEPARPKHAPLPAGRKPRILMVDDKKDYREVVQYVLAEAGCEVSTAEDGVAGLAAARSVRPDLILLDFNMPGLNGYEVLQELRADDDLRKTRIIMFTGAAHRRHLRQMGMDIDDFLDKPISNTRLVDAIEQALSRHRGGENGEVFLPLRHEGGRAEPVPPEAAEAAPAAPVVEEPAPEPEPEPILPDLAAATQAPDAVAEPTVPVPVRPGEKPEEMPHLEDLERVEGPDDGALLFDIEKADEKKADDVRGLEEMDDNSPLVKQINRILVRAVEMGASDIHIESQETRVVVRVRLNGSLKSLTNLPGSLGPRVAVRIKIMSELSITERRLPQDGQFRATINGRKIEFRVSTLPSAYGEKIVLRILGGSKIEGSLGDLGLSERAVGCVERALRTSHGLILVTGPTGSGKTTSLYTMLGLLNQADVNIMTAEDPIEYRLAGITQVHVQPAIGLTFEAVLRSFLRQDPDIMLVGEIRDLETAEIAVKASITGHLVLSTLHTNSAPATIARLTHMGLAPYLLAASVKLVAAQRLLKVLCPHCKVPAPLGVEERRVLSEAEAARLGSIYRSVGCRECRQTGFVGRRPIFEVMPVRTFEMRQVILSKGDADRIAEQAVKEGMVPLREAAMDMVSQGLTSLPEALKIVLAE